MKTILCFGDSNTWGFLPGGDGARAQLSDRWPSVMAAALNAGTRNDGSPNAGKGFHVVAEGLNGRTTVFEDPMSPGRSGIAALPMLLDSHAPIDLVIIMLGTNDTKNFYQVSAEQSALGIELLARVVATSDAGPVTNGAEPRTKAAAPAWPPVGPAPHLLIVAPAPIGALDEHMRPHFAPEARAQEVSQRLVATYRTVATETGAAFFDAGTVVGAGTDGVHLDIAAQRTLGGALAENVRELMGGDGA